MTRVAVGGGGPAGLSAAPFAAKSGLDVVLFDTDDARIHEAHLFNYLGIGSVDGSAFMSTARDQVDEFGVDRRQGAGVTDVAVDGDDFALTTDANEDVKAEYVVLATGANRDLAVDPGCETTEEGVVDVDVMMGTSVDGAYATGATVRAEEWQAASDGAAAALNVLTREKGDRFHDFGTPADATETFGAMVED